MQTELYRLLRQKFTDNKFTIEEIATDMYNVSVDPMFKFAVVTQVEKDKHYIILLRHEDNHGYKTIIVSDVASALEVVGLFLKYLK